jgi:hypothetical protein
MPLSNLIRDTTLVWTAHNHGKNPFAALTGVKLKAKDFIRPMEAAAVNLESPGQRSPLQQTATHPAFAPGVGPWNYPGTLSMLGKKGCCPNFRGSAGFQPALSR